jgi:HAD superfamily hydrolase (TIGR01509 family)
MQPWLVSNVLFDLGGVLLSVDYAASAKAFDTLGFPNFATWYAQGKQTALFDALETGAIDAIEFRAALREQGCLGCDDLALDAAWNAMLIGFEPEMLATLRALRQRYRLLLFSNTNAIHQRRVQQLLRKHAPSATLHDFFDGTYFSHEVGARKPAPDAFLAVLNDAGARARETLFIDDSLENVRGAACAGLHTWHVRSPLDLLHTLHPETFAWSHDVTVP